MWVPQTQKWSSTQGPSRWIWNSCSPQPLPARDLEQQGGESRPAPRSQLLWWPGRTSPQLQASQNAISLPSFPGVRPAHLLTSPPTDMLMLKLLIPLLLRKWKSLSLFETPWTIYSPWNSPGQNTGVGSLSFLQGIFPTQGTNPGLLHCRQILYQLSHEGSPRILEWVAFPFSRTSSRPRSRTGVPCIAGGRFTNWAIREAKQRPAAGPHASLADCILHQTVAKPFLPAPHPQSLSFNASTRLTSTCGLTLLLSGQTSSAAPFLPLPWPPAPVSLHGCSLHRQLFPDARPWPPAPGAASPPPLSAPVSSMTVHSITHAASPLHKNKAGRASICLPAKPQEPGRAPAFNKGTMEQRRENLSVFAQSSPRTFQKRKIKGRNDKTLQSRKEIQVFTVKELAESWEGWK